MQSLLEKPKQETRVTQGMQETQAAWAVKETQAAQELSIHDLLIGVEKADARQKSEIENTIVDMGSRAIPELVELLQIIKGTTRGVVAMVLIRIGKVSINYLQNKAKANSDFDWIARYLTAEILGTAEIAA